MVCRVAKSFIRFGTFQLPASRWGTRTEPTCPQVVVGDRPLVVLEMGQRTSWPAVFQLPALKI